MVTKKEWTRGASSGCGTIYSVSWSGENPKALLVVAHGMAEHSARYESFARYFAEKGYAVYLNDHAGHGKSARIKGHFADENGWESVVKDIGALMDEAQGEHPGLPVILMGHSMGSFLSRSFISRQGSRLTGCILCGTMGKNPGVAFGKALASLQCQLKGPLSKGTFLDKLAMGGYNKGIANPVNQFAWLSTVEQVCREYAEDEYCGFVFTAAGYRDLFTGISQISSKKWAQAVPKELPIYLVAGDKDPVGNYGKGPAQVEKMLLEAGCKNVKLHLYAGMRHELLNEACRQTVMEDLLARTELWISGEK